MKTRVMPKHLVPVIENVVDYICSGGPEPSDLKQLVDKYEGDGFALNISELASSSFLDAAILSTQEGVGGGHDADRLEFARARIASAFQDPDEYSLATVHFVPVESGQGRQAILGWLMEVHGQAGAVPYFQGVLSRKEDFIGYLKRSGYVLSSERTDVTDAAILRVWTEGGQAR